MKTLPDGSINAYGFYMGGKAEWENVPVIKGEKVGETYVADIGNGIGLTWTPAASPDGVLGIPQWNTYTAFTEIGETYTKIPNALGKHPIIRINGLCELSEQG
jgi:hypothetical protein